ncbi:MAG: NepR family anti-sigma factor [Hyphomonadaceae bacterium]|nr:NepR family anti-sigma factor [Hyphomonadaceae bacterium]
MDRNEATQRGQRNDLNRQKVIGMKLKRLYADIAEEPIPGSFLSLLEQIDEQVRA